ncbi:MAG: hypothetical protein ACOCQR_03920 [bacterium]
MYEDDITQEVERNEKSFDEIVKKINPMNIYSYQKCKRMVNELVDKAEVIRWVDPTDNIPEQIRKKIIISDIPNHELGITRTLEVNAYKIEHGKIWFKLKGKEKYQAYPDVEKNRFLFDFQNKFNKVLFIIL